MESNMKSRTKTKTENDIVDELKVKNIKLIEPYKKLHDRHSLQCMTCNHIWIKQIHRILYYDYGCPICRLSRENDVIKDKNIINDISTVDKKYIKQKARIYAAIMYMGGKCEDCNYDLLKDPIVADFHHIEDKTDGIPHIKSIKDMYKELKKCKLLCCNCHRKEHGYVYFDKHKEKILQVADQYLKEFKDNDLLL